MTTQGERIAAVEVEVTHLRNEVYDLRSELKTTNEKIDKLLALQNKGMGAFWIASALFGSGLVGAAVSAFNWFK